MAILKWLFYGVKFRTHNNFFLKDSRRNIFCEIEILSHDDLVKIIYLVKTTYYLVKST